jgi:hypothetical protein
MIDKHTLEIKQDEEQRVYKDLQSIGDDLPDHSPRFVLLSYPLTLVSALQQGKVHQAGIETDPMCSPLGVSRFRMCCFTTSQ